MAPKKSALSAALGGEAPQPQARTSIPSKSILDPSAFPCIAFASEIDAGGGATESDPVVEADFDVARFIPVGSAPTSVLFNGMAMVSRMGLACVRLGCPERDSLPAGGLRARAAEARRQGVHAYRSHGHGA